MMVPSEKTKPGKTVKLFGNKWVIKKLVVPRGFASKNLKVYAARIKSLKSPRSRGLLNE